MYSQDIGMEFGIEKWPKLQRKSGKRYLIDGMELPNQDKFKTFGEKNTLKYLELLETDTIKQEMKEKNKK